MQQLGKNIRNWKYILLGIIIILSGCAKHNKDDKKHNELGSGDKSNLPVSLDLLIEHAE